MSVTVSLLSSQPLVGDSEPSAVLLITDGASSIQLDIETFFQVYDVLAKQSGMDADVESAEVVVEPDPDDVYESVPLISESSPHRLRVRASVPTDPE